MDDTIDTVNLALALEHMTGPSRGSVTWLNASTLDVTLDAECFVLISETQAGGRGEDLIARLHRIDDTYEIEALADHMVWLNGDRITHGRLKHGDTIEFGESGPLCRIRFYSDHSPIRNSASDILSDIAAYLKVSRQPIPKRVFRACGALFSRLTHETSTLFRITVLAAIVGLGVFAYQQQQLNKLLKTDIETAAAQLDSVAAALVNTQKRGASGQRSYAAARKSGAACHVEYHATGRTRAALHRQRSCNCRIERVCCVPSRCLRISGAIWSTYAATGGQQRWVTFDIAQRTAIDFFGG